MKFRNLLNKYSLFKGQFLFLVLFVITILQSNAQNTDELDPSARIVQSFDSGWLFYNGEAQGAEETKYKPKEWRLINVPHDWSIEGTVNRDNPTGRGGGYFATGIGWYRKSFTLSKEEESKRVFIEFDGVMANSQVWINGHLLGQRPYGYIGFSYELTDHLFYGKKENIIVVKADNTTQPASRWYTGAGIYRHVRLITTNPVHIKQWGIYITTPDVTEQEAKINVQTTILNQSKTNVELKIITSLLSPSGEELSKSVNKQEINAESSLIANDVISVRNPERWGIQHPAIYKALSQLFIGDQLVDEQMNTFGIREFHFKSATGFWLNGENIKIKGVCVHHDGGAVGAAVPLSTWELRLSQLQKLGVNAIRTAHNPFSPEFYELCDRLGLLVMNETFDTWRASKNHAEKGYNLYFNNWWEADTRDVVLRDRNHPSIIMYSVGNEIRDNLSNEQGLETYEKMQDLIHKLDPTRPVTMALFRPNSSGVYTNGFADSMDIVGQNYREKELEQAHIDNPQRIVIGTENGHTRDAWLLLRDQPFMSGQFLWTGVDYLGEADWPAISHQYGLLDRTGQETPRSFQRQSWWSENPMVHLCRNALNAGNGELVSNWTPADEDTYDVAQVEIYSNAEEVEIFLNGKSKGTFKVPDNAAPIRTKFSYEPGTIKVEARTNGKVVANHEMHTANKPEKISLTASRQKLSNQFDDVVYITAYICDTDGVCCPNADQLLNFSVSGTGDIIATDNADPESHVPFSATSRRALSGRCIAIIRANQNSGQIKVKVQADDLETGEITLEIMK